MECLTSALLPQRILKIGRSYSAAVDEESVVHRPIVSYHSSNNDQIHELDEAGIALNRETKKSVNRSLED